MKFVLDMVHHNPSEKRTETKYLRPEYLKELGFNGQVIKNINLAASYGNASPGTVENDVELAGWIRAVRTEFDRQIQEAKNAGLGFYSHIDPFLFPRAVVDRHREDIRENGAISIHRDKTVELLEDMIGEVVGRYPEIDGLVIRVGETYLQDSPHHTGNNPVRYFSDPNHDFRDGDIFIEYNDRRNDLREEQETLIRLIKVLRRIVCEEHGKILIFRTWDVFEDRFHADREYYLAVTDRIIPHENLYFSIKHTRLDFLRNVEPNPCLGTGRHDQLVEIQFQREYEGKGAFPNYFAHHLIDGFPETQSGQGLRQLLESERIKGVFCWSRGGGWYGPYVADEFWIDLNLHVFLRWLESPEKPEHAIFSAWLEDSGFSAESRRLVRRIAVLSSDAILKGRYCSIGHIDKLWMRDDVIGGLEQLGRWLEGLRNHGQDDAVLTEKAESLAIWKEIATLSERIGHSDAKRREFIVGSCQYGLRLFTVVAEGWRLMFRDMAPGGCTPADIEEFSAAWKDYRHLTIENPAVSTLYRGRYWNWPGEELTPGLLDSIQSIAGRSTDGPKKGSGS